MAQADLQWNRPTQAAARRRPVAIAVTAPTSAVRPAAYDEPIAAPTATAQFDPFDSPFGENAPATDDVAQVADPFESNLFGGMTDDSHAADGDATGTGPLDNDATSPLDAANEEAAPGFDPFEDPPAPEPEPPAPEDQLEAAEQAIEEELVRRDADEQLQNELSADDDMADETVDDDTIERELPSFDSTEFDSNLEDVPYDWREDETAPKTLTPEQDRRRRELIANERAQAAKDCEELQSIARQRRITDISLDISLDGDPGEDYPFECALGDELFAGRAWPQITYRWKASGLCHKPLYFEQVQLERYGHSWGPYVQPIMSGAHFFATFPILPYKMGLKTPNECVYTLGYYRPGSCAPYMIEAVPFTWRAALFQGAAATGTAFVIP